MAGLAVALSGGVVVGALVVDGGRKTEPVVDESATTTLPSQAEAESSSSSGGAAAVVDPGADDDADAAEAAVPPPAGGFVATFDGAPGEPTPWRPSDWDVTVHSRDASTFDRLESMEAGHGPDCSGPPSVHTVSSYESSVYLCRDHMMTAINAGGYGMIYLTPDQMVDFSGGEATIRFDVSTLRTSVRDWWDVWITPYDDNLQLPLDLGSDVDVTGPPRNTVHVTLGSENQIKADIQKDFEPVTFPDWPEDVVTGDVFTGYETFLEPDLARRDTVEVVISRTHLKVGMPAYDFWWIDTEIPELAWDRGVVQFGHHSYNPVKDCNVENTPRPPIDACTPNTWHWDNVTFSDAVPFTIIHADARAASESDPVLELVSPAPADGHLRFAGIGTDLEVRFDDGPWEAAERQATERDTNEEHFASYWHPIPEGARTVSFRAVDWWGGPWLARDVTVWSPNAG